MNKAAIGFIIDILDSLCLSAKIAKSYWIWIDMMLLEIQIRGVQLRWNWDH